MTLRTMSIATIAGLLTLGACGGNGGASVDKAVRAEAQAQWDESTPSGQVGACSVWLSAPERTEEIFLENAGDDAEGRAMWAAFEDILRDEC